MSLLQFKMRGTEQEIEMEQSTVSIIKRNTINSLEEVNSNGKKHTLGIVKDLRSIPAINSFIPHNARLSISWVRLDKDQVLDVHTHPIESLYIMAEGQAYFFDDITKKPLGAGDIILIPRGAKHGFIGAGENGYWALSIQMEQRGLYENLDEPLVQFNNQINDNFFENLDEENDRYLSKFSKNNIFKTLKDIKNNNEFKNLFLDYLQILSDNFQTMMLLRSALCADEDYNEIFLKHLFDEFGHNQHLKNSRKNYKKIDDPVFESLCLWFNHKVLQLDKIEQLYLINRIIEKSAHVFYTRSFPYFSDLNIDHFKDHAVHDEVHCDLGLEKLKNITQNQYNNLMALQESAWKIIEAQYNHLSKIINKGSLK